MTIFPFSSLSSGLLFSGPLFSGLRRAGLLALMLLAAVASAQPHGDRFEALAERLELSENQLEPVRAILDERREAGRALMQGARDGNVDRESLEAERAALEAATRSDLAAVLTPAQLEAFDALGEERRERHRARREERREAGFERLSAELDLHESQAASVREILEASRASGRALMEASRDAPREEREASFAELKADTRDALAGVLTPEQLVRLDELEAERREHREQRRSRRGRHAPDEAPRGV